MMGAIAYLTTISGGGGGGGGGGYNVKTREYIKMEL